MGSQRAGHNWMTFTLWVKHILQYLLKGKKWDCMFQYVLLPLHLIAVLAGQRVLSSFHTQFWTYMLHSSVAALKSENVLTSRLQSDCWKSEAIFSLLYLFHICDCKCMCSHVKSVLISGFYRRFWNDRKPVLLGYCKTQHIAVYRGFTSWNTSETSLWMMLVIFTGFA